MENKVCQNCKQDFTTLPEDFSFYEKIKVPPPTFCFECRLQRRTAFMNERTLFKRACDKCKKSVVSMYSPEAPHVVWCSECYFSDGRDPMSEGMDYDFNKSFFEQFYELFKKVPRLHLAHKNNNAEGCEYANYAYRCKNAYLSFNAVRSEDIYYSKEVLGGNKICIDSKNIIDNERGYELVDTSNSYNSRFLINSGHCVDSAFLFNCRNCTDCCLSTNQYNKSYVFRNKQLTREAYIKAKEELRLDTYSGQVKAGDELRKLAEATIRKYSRIRNAPNCTGNFIMNSNNARYSFDLVQADNVKYIFFGVNVMRDSYDLLFCGKSELCYELTNAGSVNSSVFFSLDIGTGVNVQYSVSCNTNNNLFGCIGLYGKDYCILNKQYTKEEFETLAPKIIVHMNEMPYVDKKGRVYRYGEYFPTELSPFAYNESLAYETFPLTKQQTLGEGYLWRDAVEKQHTATIESKDLPESINDVQDSVLSETIACPNNGRTETLCTAAYRITPDELRFYRLMKIPLPRHCPNCRYYARRHWQLPWKLWHRKCMKEGCNNAFETPYAPERPEIIYCENCYQKEVL